MFLFLNFSLLSYCIIFSFLFFFQLCVIELSFLFFFLPFICNLYLYAISSLRYFYRADWADQFLFKDPCLILNLELTTFTAKKGGGSSREIQINSSEFAFIFYFTFLLFFGFLPFNYFSAFFKYLFWLAPTILFLFLHLSLLSYRISFSFIFLFQAVSLLLKFLFYFYFFHSFIIFIFLLFFICITFTGLVAMTIFLIKGRVKFST